MTRPPFYCKPLFHTIISPLLCLFRDRYLPMSSKAAAQQAAALLKKGNSGGFRGHNGGVSGLGVDAMNRYMVSVGVDGLLVFWDFKDRRAKGGISVGSGVGQLEMVSHVCEAEDLRQRWDSAEVHTPATAPI